MKFTYMAAALAALLAAPAALAQTVPNAGFEEPSVASVGYAYDPTATGMTFNGRSGVATGTFFTGAPVDGAQAGFIQNTSELAGAIGISLSDLIAGSTYNASFYLAQRVGYGVNPIEVFFDGASLGVFAPSGASFEQFTSANFIATGATGTLSFLGTGPRTDSDTAIDAVSVTNLTPVDGAVPEPATWAMLTLGFGAVGGAMRRRRSTSPAFA